MTEGAPLSLSLRWIDDQHLEVAQGHVFDTITDCLSMPHLGRQVEVCTHLFRSSGPLDSDKRPPGTAVNPSGDQWAVVSGEQFCVVGEGVQECFEIPSLGVPASVEAHPLYGFVRSTKHVFLASSADLGAEDADPSSCIRLRVELDPLFGGITLYGPRQPQGDDFQQDVFRVSVGPQVTVNHGGRTLDAGGHVLVSGGLMCDAIVADEVQEKSDSLVLRYEGTTRRWFRDEATCNAASPERVVFALGKCA